MADAAHRRSSHLETEIRAQPDALRALLAAEAGTARDTARAWRARRDVSMLLLAARGSSDNAARYAQYVFGARNALPVAPAGPSLFTRYRQPPRLAGAAAIAISQSGRSPDVVAVIAEANAQGRPTLAITNDPASPLAAEADAVMALRTGEEVSVAATKTYVASLAALALLSAALEGDGEFEAEEELAAAPGAVERAVQASLSTVAVPGWLRDAASCAVVGRGYNFATAHEIALKITELTGVAAQPYSSADFLHGPVAAVGDGYPVILVAPAGMVHEDVATLAGVLRDRGARLAAVSDDDALLAAVDLPLRLPVPMPEWLSPLAAVVPGQVLAWRLADARGLDPDRPRGLRKITETR